MNNNKMTIIKWIKRIAGLVTVIVWISVLYSIFQAGGVFNEQAPKCIISTMIIFSILTAIFKGLEYWERQV